MNTVFFYFVETLSVIFMFSIVIFIIALLVTALRLMLKLIKKTDLEIDVLNQKRAIFAQKIQMVDFKKSIQYHLSYGTSQGFSLSLSYEHR